MSQENVELARHFYGVNRTFLERATAGKDIRGDPEWWSMWDPDAVIVEIAEFPDAGTYRGYDEMQRWIQGWLDAFDEISVEPQDFIPVGDHVVVTTNQRFRSKAGVEVQQEITQVLRFRRGKLIYATGYRDRSNALEAAGLRE
jgi:ketosteroid isomerase-like protein